MSAVGEEPEMNDYDIEMSALTEETCWRMLAREAFGRIGLLDWNELTVLPVNVGVSKRRLVFRTTAGSTLARHAGGAKVAFESDHIDPVAESGWSVIVKGRLWDVTDEPEVANWSDFAVRAWAPPPHDRWMMIEPTMVTGRLVQRHRRLATLGVPYMSPD
jgi:nitroimidazol reductase NimA-like FMN-containing flavoprotein (pyridoxamine 5'-phosphate oxidase superfamily)